MLGLILSSNNRTAGPLLFAITCFGIAGAGGYWLWTRWLHTATVAVENGAVKLTETRLFASGSTTTIPCEAIDDVRVELQGEKHSSRPTYSLSLVQAPSRSTGSRSNQREICFAGNLDDKAVAEWIANRIRDGVKQQASPA